MQAIYKNFAFYILGSKQGLNDTAGEVRLDENLYSRNGPL